MHHWPGYGGTLIYSPRQVRAIEEAEKEGAGMSDTKLTKAMLDCLEMTEWGMEQFGSILTGRNLKLRVMRLCVAHGLCKCIGLTRVCDADGYIQWHKRQRAGYVLTKKGMAVLAKSRRGLQR